MEKNLLNQIDGNLLNLPLNERDLYHCSECESYVTEDDWNNKRNMCFSCWWEIK